jgi:hypothetical protein
MDLGAFLLINSLKGLLPSEPPRLRGLRLMKLEDKIEEETSPQYEMFNKYAGTDTLYIHTRCGGDNYTYFEMDKWEKDNKVLDGVDDEFDITYRDSYIAIPKDKMEDYQKILIESQKDLAEVKE